MSTGYGWEGLRQVCATLLGARHVPERLCGGLPGLDYFGRYNKCSPLPLPFLPYPTIGLTDGRTRVSSIVCYSPMQSVIPSKASIVLKILNNHGVCKAREDFKLRSIGLTA